MCRPKLAVRREPIVELGERLGADPVQPPLRVGAGLDQAGVFEHSEVLRDGGLADAQSVDEVAHRSFAVAEEVENLLPSRFSEGFEGGELGHAASMTTRLYARQEMEAPRSARSIASAMRSSTGSSPGGVSRR